MKIVAIKGSPIAIDRRTCSLWTLFAASRRTVMKTHSSTHPSATRTPASAAESAGRTAHASSVLPRRSTTVSCRAGTASRTEATSRESVPAPSQSQHLRSSAHLTGTCRRGKHIVGLKAASAALAMCALLTLSGCAQLGGEAAARIEIRASSSASINETAAVQQPETTTEAAETPMAGEIMNVTATLNGQDFDIELADNDTARAFAEMLPLSGTLSELNGNEKYLRVSEDLPSNPTNPGTIEAGDVMLYQDDCIVVFYETHQSSYAYTRIGKIVDTAGLASAVGSGSVAATFAAR